MMASKKTLKKLRLSLRRGEKISKGLKQLATLQLEAAIDELRGNNVSPGPVHNARTYIKKVRALVWLAAPALGRVRREYLIELLHEAGSRLGPLRGSEVQVQSLDLMIEEASLPAEQFSSLRNGLLDIAKQRRANDIRQIPRIVEFIEKVRRSVPDWPLEPLGARDIRRRIRRTYRRGRTTLDSYSASGDPELFHTWRKLVKQLGYQLHITAKHWPDEASSLIGAITRIGEIAGRERDYTMLLKTMQHGPRSRSSEEAISLITSLLPTIKQEAIEKGLKFYELKPKTFVDSLDL